MSQNEQGSSKSKLPTAIKIAATDGSRSRGNNDNSGQPTPDVGPGDPAAAPSVAPELVEVPEPPTPSQLVVKSNSPIFITRERNVKEASKNAIGPSASVGFGAGTSAGFGADAGFRAKNGSGSGSKSETATETESRARSASNVASGVPASNLGSSKPAAAAPASSVSPDEVESLGEEERRTGAQVMSLKPSDSQAVASHGTSKNKKVSPKQEFSPGGSTKSPHHDNKVTKFRYHRRVTVHTTGKVNPDGILEKVSPQNLEDMNPEELIKKTGIKPNSQTHWRIRLRQTKRLTKGGKTTSQTKVAYRDSDGNIKKEGGSVRHGSPNTERVCKRCEKKLVDCKCDTSSAQR